MPDSFEVMAATLATLAGTPARDAWFAAQCAARGLRLDGAAVGWWQADDSSGPALLIGSEVGIVTSLAAIDLLRERAFVPRVGTRVGIGIVAAGAGSRGTYRFDFTGPGAGVDAAMDDRHDPMLSYAMTALAASKQARLAGQRATFGRVEVVPDAADRVPARVTGWLDLRCGDDDQRDALLVAVQQQGTLRADRDGTRLVVTAEVLSVSGGPPCAQDPWAAVEALAEKLAGLAA